MTVYATLGDFTFLNNEVPYTLNGGGDQNMSVHQLIGGQRRVDVMGRSDDPITWQAMFKGQNAEERAHYVDGLRIAGNPLLFTYSQFSYNVVIRSFKFTFQTFYWIPYSITLQVIQDLTTPSAVFPLVSFNDAIEEALIEANALSTLIRNDPIAAAIAALNEAQQLIPSFQGATAQEINNFIAVATTARGVVGTQISQLSSTIFGAL